MAIAYTSLLEETLQAWEYTRNGLIAEVENIAEAEFEFRPTPEVRSVAELVNHILEATRIATGELTRPDGDFTRQSYAEFVREYAGAPTEVGDEADLLSMLRSTWEEGDRRFREAGELFMLQFIRRFDGQPGTRLAWLNHHIDHEMYHRGQLALYARLLGRVPALTQQIQG
jgi:uncharacterized damage-inducible protein DinB